MKRIYTYILIMAAALSAAVSCSNEALEKDTPAPKGDFNAVTLRLRNIDPAETKALTGNKIPGEGNENTIHHIDYFFFGDEAGTKLLYSDRLAVSELTDKGNYTYEKEFNVTQDYPDIKYGCYAYVVANYPSTITAKTLDALMALPLTADWTQAQTNFVMDTYDTKTGSAVHALTPKTTGEVKTITLPLTRVAAKIVVNLKVAESYTDKVGNLWEPTVDQFTHQIYRMRKTATLAGTPAAYQSDADYHVSTSYIRNLTAEPERNTNDKPVAVEGYYNYTLAPYYTYPQAFDTSNEKSPYIKFQLPWVNEKKGSNNFYYKFLMPELTSFDRNRIYIFDAVIDVIGGTEDDWAEVINQIYVADWWTPGTITATYESAKYLSVINHTYTIYGEDSITVPVISSDEIQIVSFSGTKKNLQSGNNVTVTTTVTANGKESFTLQHELINDIDNSQFDCTPITYTVTIQHKAGGLTKQETVKIVQYPNIYVEEMLSNGYAFVNETGNASGADNISDDIGNSLGSLTRRSSVNGNGDNNNQHNYNIYVSVLPDGSNSVIGDPRVGATAVNNLGNDVTNSYKAAGEHTQNVIAPAFKIASSYGKTNYLDYTYAKERCAAYQESGYPAGRWRLPTVAEIDFIMSLSESTVQHIPTLFDPGYDTNGYWAEYWAGGGWAYVGKTSYMTSGGKPVKAFDFSNIPATGTVTKTHDSVSYTVGRNRDYYQTRYSNTNRNNLVWARCVYDIWYWGDAPMTNDGGTATAQTDANGNVTGYTGAATEWLGYKMD